MHTFNIYAHVLTFVQHTLTHRIQLYKHIHTGTHSYIWNLNVNITPHVQQIHAHNLTITGKHIQAHTHAHI